VRQEREKEAPQHAPKDEALHDEGNRHHEEAISQLASGDKTQPKVP